MNAILVPMNPQKRESEQPRLTGKIIRIYAFLSENYCNKV